MSGSGISWAVCKSAPRSRQITMPAPHHSGAINNMNIALLCPVVPRRRGALSDAAICPSVCPSTRRTGAGDYRHAGCLQPSHVRTVDPPVRRRVELPLHIVSPSPGDTLLLTELLQKQTFLNRSVAVHRSTRSTQPCIPPGSLNRVPASAGVRAGMSPLPGGR